MNVEIRNRNESFLESVKAMKAAIDAAEKFPEYPEHIAIINELNSAIDGIKNRLLSFAKTEDKGMMTRIHQLDAVLSET